MIDKAISSFTVLVSPAYLALSLLDHRYAIAGILGAWWMFSRSAKMLAHLERKSWRFITMMPFFILVSFAMSLTKIVALLTAFGELEPTAATRPRYRPMVRLPVRERVSGCRRPGRVRGPDWRPAVGG